MTDQEHIEAEIKERVRIANERVAKARGEKESQLICDDERTDPHDECGSHGKGITCEQCHFYVRRGPTDYASGDTEWNVLLKEIRAAVLKQLGNVSIFFDFEDIVYIDIHGGCPHTEQSPDLLAEITAPILSLAIAETWIELDKLGLFKCKTCEGSGNEYVCTCCGDKKCAMDGREEVHYWSVTCSVCKGIGKGGPVKC